MSPQAANSNSGALIQRLLLVGHGKMGGALLAGWRRAGIADQYDVVEPSAALPKDVLEQGDVVHHSSSAALAAEPAPEVVVLAVKPQAMAAVLGDYRRYATAQTLFLSIAAGRTLLSFENALGEAAIIRAMPNTPAAIGQGVSVLVANATAQPAQRALAERLMEAAGPVLWLDDERLIDVVTAVSGGGPAYVFLLIEALAAAGCKAGLEVDMAMQLARQTVIGSGQLAAFSPEEPAALRRNVTSPQGTTEAALKILMAADGLQPLLDAAIAAATARSRALSD